jgi:multidrug resistance efflux pump
MSEIQRYKLVVGDFDAELLPDDFGSYVEYRDHQANIKELESQLAEAKKDALEAKQDQARYQYIFKKMVVMSETGSRAFVGREEVEPYVDAAIVFIQENQQ